jgi:hypothetical protein
MTILNIGQGGVVVTVLNIGQAGMVTQILVIGPPAAVGCRARAGLGLHRQWVRVRCAW